MPVLYSETGLPVQYATAEEFGVWLDPRPLPANPDPLLRHASRIVAHAVREAVATDDATGIPTDAGHAATLRDATTAQAETMIGLYSTASGGTFGQTLDGFVTTVATTSDSALFTEVPVAPEALRILRTGGLLNAVVPTR